MHTFRASGFGLLAATFCAATSSGVCPAGKQAYAIQKTIGFDDLPVTQVSTVNDVTTNGLYFQAGAVRGPSAVSGLVGVAPNTPPNAIQSNQLIQTASGDFMVTVNYPNSNTTAFDVSSLRGGCTLSTGVNGGAAAQGCVINFVGYKGSDNSIYNAQEVCAFSLAYNPSTNVGVQQLAFRQAPSSCQGLSFLTVQATIEPATIRASQLLLGIVLDTLAVATFGCK